jgi:hypothetical protein
MDGGEPNAGRPNPKAPAELSRFAFLIGRWTCDARVRLVDGEWQHLNISEKHFTWRGEQSDDRKAWSEFMVVEAHRTNE